MLVLFKSGLILTLTLFVSINAFAKRSDKISDWIKARGEITDIKVVPTLSDVEIELKMDVTFKNIGIKPVFIYNKDPYIGFQALALSLEDDKNKKFAFKISFGLASFYGSPESIKERKKLNQKKVPEEMFLVLQPLEEKKFQFETVVGVLRKPYNSYEKKWSEISKNCEIWLRVGMRAWRSSLLETGYKSKFGKKLQKRWKDEGYLALGYIITEPMKLTLPQNTGCKTQTSVNQFRP